MLLFKKKEGIMQKLENKINGFEIYFKQVNCDNGAIIRTMKIGERERNFKLFIRLIYWARNYDYPVKFQFCGIDAYSNDWEQVYKEIKTKI